MLTIKAAVFRYKIETAVLILPVAAIIAYIHAKCASRIRQATHPIPPTRDDSLNANENILLPRFQYGSASLSEAEKRPFLLIPYDEQMSVAHYRPPCAYSSRYIAATPFTILRTNFRWAPWHTASQGLQRDPILRYTDYQETAFSSYLHPHLCRCWPRPDLAGHTIDHVQVVSVKL